MGKGSLFFQILRIQVRIRGWDTLWAVQCLIHRSHPACILLCENLVNQLIILSQNLSRELDHTQKEGFTHISNNEKRSLTKGGLIEEANVAVCKAERVARRTYDKARLCEHRRLSYISIWSFKSVGRLVFPKHTAAAGELVCDGREDSQPW